MPISSLRFQATPPGVMIYAPQVGVDHAVTKRAAQEHKSDGPGRDMFGIPTRRPQDPRHIRFAVVEGKRAEVMGALRTSSKALSELGYQLTTLYGKTDPLLKTVERHQKALWHDITSTLIKR